MRLGDGSPLEHGIALCTATCLGVGLEPGAGAMCDAMSTCTGDAWLTVPTGVRDLGLRVQSGDC